MNNDYAAVSLRCRGADKKTICDMQRPRKDTDELIRPTLRIGFDFVSDAKGAVISRVGDHKCPPQPIPESEDRPQVPIFGFGYISISS